MNKGGFSWKRFAGISAAKSRISSRSHVPDCLLGEIRRQTIYCRHYKLATMIDHDEKPEYCKVEKIINEEGE